MSNYRAASPEAWRGLIRRSSLPASVRLVALTMSDYADTVGRNARPGLPRLMADTGQSRNTVKRALAELRQCGLLHEERRANRPGEGSLYVLAVPPAGVARTTREHEHLISTLLEKVRKASLQGPSAGRRDQMTSPAQGPSVGPAEISKSAAHEVAGTICGTPTYMSADAIVGEVAAPLDPQDPKDSSVGRSEAEAPPAGEADRATDAPTAPAASVGPAGGAPASPPPTDDLWEGEIVEPWEWTPEPGAFGETSPFELHEPKSGTCGEVAAPDVRPAAVAVLVGEPPAVPVEAGPRVTTAREQAMAAARAATEIARQVRRGRRS